MNNTAAIPGQVETEFKRRGRRRLIGAVAIALLLAVFLPMVFDSEPKKKSDELSLTIPAKDSVKPLALPAPAEKKAEPAKPAPKEAKAATVTPAPVAPSATGSPTPTPSTVAQPPANAPASVAAVAPSTAIVTPPAAKQPTPTTQGDNPLDGFAVQLGSFREEAKAKALGQRLASLKFSYFFERRDSPEGELIRVRVGPFKTDAEAQQALAKVKQAGLDGSVVKLR